MKKAIALLVVMVALGLLGWEIHKRIREQADGPGRRGGVRAMPVEAQPVSRQTMREISEFVGTLQPRSQFVVAPKVAGLLERLHVNIDDEVQNGGTIAELDSAEYDQQAAQAEAELGVARASLAESESALAVAEREHNRFQELFRQQVASESELESSKARFDAAEARRKVALAQIEQREAALRAAQVRQSYTRIRVTWEGGGETRRVAERFIDEGAMLRANDPIVSLVDIDEVTVVINVIERDFPRIRTGQATTVFTDAYPGEAFEGQVIRRAPVLREESRQGRVEIAIANPGYRLAPGMFVRVHIQFAEYPNATVVPAQALVRRNGLRGVFLADAAEGVARFVPVQVGVEEAPWAQILEPALEGQVVTLGQHLLEDGALIALPGAGGPGGGPASPGQAQQGGRP